MNKAESKPSTLKVKWRNFEDPSSFLLGQLFSRFSYYFDVSFNNQTIRIEIEDNKCLSVDECNFMIFSSDGNFIALDNSEAFFRSITGFHFESLTYKEYSEILSIYFSCMPASFIKIFGNIIPNFGGNFEKNYYSIKIKLHSEDCSIICNAIACPSFWLSILNNSELIRKEKEIDNDKFLETENKFKVPLGNIKIDRNELLKLSSGDLLKLDNSFFSKDGKGVIKLDRMSLYVSLIEREEVDIFELTKKD